MRFMAPSVIISALIINVAAPLSGVQPNRAIIELQSGPLTPALTLDESPQPIHQIRFFVDAQLKHGTIVLDGNKPEFDAFGGLVGGLQTPHVRGKGNAALRVKLECSIQLVEEGPKKWRLYHLRGPKLDTPIRVATRGSIANGGPARFIVLGSDNKVKTVIPCTRFGLVVP